MSVCSFERVYAFGESEVNKRVGALVWRACFVLFEGSARHNLTTFVFDLLFLFFILPIITYFSKLGPFLV